MKQERGEGELHTIAVIVILVLLVMMFPQTFKGFLGWVGDGVYAAFDAGESPFHQENGPNKHVDKNEIVKKSESVGDDFVEDFEKRVNEGDVNTAKKGTKEAEKK